MEPNLGHIIGFGTDPFQPPKGTVPFGKGLARTLQATSVLHTGSREGMRLQSSPSLPPVTKLSHIEVRKTWQVATVLGKYTPAVEIPTVSEVRMYISSPCSTCVCTEGLFL